MTFFESELLALRLQALLEQRAALRRDLESSLQNVLTSEERSDVQRALDVTCQEVRTLQARLESLRSRPGSGGTG